MNNLILGNNQDLEVTKIRIIRFEKEQIIEKYPVLLLDVSGSMQENVGNRRKIDILRDAVTKVGVGMEVYVFASDFVKTKYIPEPHGSTNLKQAFKSLSGQSMQLLLVGDGVSDDPEEAIRAGVALRCPVNVLYIGEPGDQGEAFMRRLAEATCGKWLTLDTMQDAAVFQDKLENGIQNMLLLGS